MASLEQRKRFEKTIGDRVAGFAGGQLRIAGGTVLCEDCGGPMPCSECARDTIAPAQARSTPIRLADHTFQARAEYELLKAGGSVPTSLQKSDALAEARRWFDEQQRRDATKKTP